jgi:PQQ-dependent catabolism-associated beta-propeller protein
MSRQWSVVMLACLSVAFAPAGDPNALVYVSNERSSTVSVIDTAADRVVHTVHVQGRPRGLAVRDGRLYVALSDQFQNVQGDEDAIVAIDPDSGKIVARYDAGTDPERFVLSHDGRLLIAANEDAGTATITELATGKILETLVVGIEPEGVGISPDGRWVYVTAETSNTVSVIDMRARKVVKSFVVDPRPRVAAFSPDGKFAYVSSEIGSSVSRIDVARHEVIDVVELEAPAHPVGVVASPDGRWVYVATGHGNSVAIIDVRTWTVDAIIPVGRRPWGVAINSDGTKLYTANGLSNDVSVVDTATRRVVKVIAAGEGPWDVAGVCCCALTRATAPVWFTVHGSRFTRGR